MQGTEDILGHERLITTLWDVAHRDQQHHAYLFEGPKGIGKRLLAQRFAMAINCEMEGSGSSSTVPCGTCPTCTEIAQGLHADVILIEPRGESATRVITVDAIREVIRVTGLHRYQAKQRIIIIDPIDALNEAGANALLKTLEAPPQGTGFLLITARASALLPTILSRCQRLRFGAVPTPVITDWLLKQEVEATTAQRAAELAQGCPGRALVLAQGELAVRDEAKQRILEVLSGTPHDRFTYSETLTRGKRADWMTRVEQLLALLEELLRDVTLYATDSPLPLFHPDVSAQIEPWSTALWPGGVQRCVRAIHGARDELRANVTGRTVVDALLARITEETQVSR